ncbi:MAG: hypothetical protein KDI37_00340 [Xanthomonadales bacterium]|nr:hypothetical protein [Xanthomonadales bacterium]MCB1640152.1 hypothetical protein [Xanthomonadales bacterium]
MTHKNRKSSKLASLKDWLTLEDAAKYLSELFDDHVRTRDVLQFALEGKLTISVWFVNSVHVRKGRIVPLADCLVRVVPGANLGSPESMPVEASLYTRDELRALPDDVKLQISAGRLDLKPDAARFSEGDEWLILDEKVSSIRGVWDLPPRSASILHVRDRFGEETDGPRLDQRNFGSVFVCDGEAVCQLQVRSEWDPDDFGSHASLNAVQERILREKLDDHCAQRLLDEYEVARRAFLERQPSFFPAKSLPNNALWIVRTSALHEFERTFLDDQPNTEAQLGSRKETNYLNIIGALVELLAQRCAGDASAGRSTVSQAAIIAALLDAHGGKPGINERTLQSKFAEAKRSLRAC